MSDHRGTGEAGEADKRAVLARLAAHGATETAATIHDEEILVEPPDTTTPAEGMALLRAAEDDPDGDLRIERPPGVGYADLLAQVAGRRVRLRVLLRTRGVPRQRGGGS